jgi:hypothetical protein
MNLPDEKEFDAFLSHSHADAEWVERLAQRLEDECGFRVWLDRWHLVPGESWQQEMAIGLDRAKTCIVCVGSTTPQGWFRQEIERALDIQSKDNGFRVIPLLLPDVSAQNVLQFLSLRTWADFRHGKDEQYAYSRSGRQLRRIRVLLLPLLQSYVSLETYLQHNLHP